MYNVRSRDCSTQEEYQHRGAFCGGTHNTGLCLNTLELYAVPQIQDAGVLTTAVFQQDGDPLL